MEEARPGPESSRAHRPRHPALAWISEFVRQQATKPVPRNLSWLYTAGTLAAFFFAVQTFSGLLLLAVYVPDARFAFASVQTIEHKLSLGWLVRQMHAWGASFIVIVLLFHILKVLWYGSYKRPRELTWFAGFLLLVVTLAFCLSGYLLPWNQLGFWATRVAVGAVDSVPLAGRWLKGIVCGSADVSGPTLGRFFALHVVLLPILLGVLATLHIALVIKLGITPKTSVPEEDELGHEGALARSGSEPFFPRQIYRELLVLNIGFALLVTAAVFAPWELGEPASQHTPEGIKPEWYFLPVYQFLKYFDDSLYAHLPFLATLEKSLGVTPEFLGILCINAFGLVLFVLPVLDRGKQRKITRRPLFAFLAFVAIAGIGLLGVLGYVSDRELTILGKKCRFSSKGYPELVAPGGEPPVTAPAGEGNQAPAAAGATQAAPALANYRSDALPLGGACVSCHEEEGKEWLGSVHAANQVQCAGCHGGIDTAPPDPLPQGLDAETYAHLGIKQKRAGGAARPAKSEVPAFCGKCHAGVLEVFSPGHFKEAPEGRSANSCVSCHSNHAVVEAGDATYEAKGAYTDSADPRHEPFQAIHSAFRQAEAALAGARSRLASLKATGHPGDVYEKEVEEAEKALKEVRYLVHGLDQQRQAVLKATAEIRESLRLTAAGIDRDLAARDERWKLVAGVWAVCGILAALAIARLRALPAG